MVMPGSSQYWDARYSDIGWREVSWFQEVPEPSRSLVTKYAKKIDAIVDVGGGASLLIDALLTDGFTDITVVDLSHAAIQTAQARVGNPYATFVVADIREWVPTHQFDVWHDRAAYHFLTDVDDQQDYWDLVRAHLKPGGTLIIATFADDGPEMCSGLPVQRYSPEELIAAMGEGFEVIETTRHTHVTPSGSEQKFVWVIAKRIH